MAELKDFQNSVAILVSSCDAFFDAWKPFVYFFRKFWPDCAFPAYLIVNELSVRSQMFRPLAVGPDRGWASNMKRALQQITAPRVLYFQEDYFLNAPVEPETLAADFNYAFANEVDALCFRARSEMDAGFQPLNDRFGVVPLNSDGRTRCQVTLWKRESFLSVLREGEDAWEMEARGSARTQEMKLLSYSTRERTPLPYLMSAIARGLWTNEALQMCAHAGVPLEPRFRETYSENSLLRRWRRTRTRKNLQRELARHRADMIDLD
ncbi:MAG: hypothetical protein ACR2NX_04825 [Chthoniobacterales bacterium]